MNDLRNAEAGLWTTVGIVPSHASDRNEDGHDFENAFRHNQLYFSFSMVACAFQVLYLAIPDPPFNA